MELEMQRIAGETVVLDESMSLDDFRRLVRARSDWVRRLFTHFKGLYDDDEASFIVLTNKPKQHALHTVIANMLQYRANYSCCKIFILTISIAVFSRLSKIDE